ncbi:MAG: hypothetical protein ACEPO2_21780 [Pelagibaca sp.]
MTCIGLRRLGPGRLYEKLSDDILGRVPLMRDDADVWPKEQAATPHL